MAARKKKQPIGKRLASLRRKKKLTLKNLANETGLSTAYISQIEKGEKTAVIMTAGGKRVRYRDGDEKAEDFTPLSAIQVDGKVRKKMKPITGPKAIKR